ncbi:MAG: hypothetical protein JXL97_15820 [Bacteroidales bacterium]|nr:hypothetical protein [Bacteroidales bacterium]
MNSDEIIKQKITAILVIEVMGRPKEHLIETLEKIVSDISNEKNVKINEKKIHEPINVKDKEDLFSSYAEIEVEIEEASTLSILAFKYMPAHIEVIEPEMLKMTAYQYGDILSELIRRLHKYDELLRVMQMEKNMYAKKLSQFMPKKDKK